MKKLVSFTLALLLCLCALLPAAAQTPVTISAFMHNYNLIFGSFATGSTISWQESVEDGQPIWIAYVENTVPMVMVSFDDSGNVKEIVVLLIGDLTEEDLYSFIVMCAFTGTTLKQINGDKDVEVSETVDETYAAMLDSLENGAEIFTLYGAECIFTVQPTADGSSFYLLVLYPNGRD